MNICEITLKKDQTPEGQKRPDLLNRKIEVPELKANIRLRVTAAGLAALKDAGGITKFLTDRDETKLSPKLKKLKAKLVAAGKIKVKGPEEEKPAEAAAPAEAKPAEAEPAKEATPAEEKPAEEKPAEAATPAKE